jgi:hypothetical protein
MEFNKEVSDYFYGSCGKAVSAPADINLKL